MKLQTRDIISLLLAVAIVFLFYKGCKSKSGNAGYTVTRDTTYVYKSDTTKLYVPKPEFVFFPPQTITLNRDRLQYIFDTLYITEAADIDTAAIMRDFFATLYYNDTTNTDYGNVIIKDTISRNRIIARQVITDFKIPIVKETITLKEKKRNELFAGVGLVGNQASPLFGAGGNLALKTKRGKIYEAGAIVTKDNGLLYYAGVKIKLSLKKQ